jgi:hypothetical protein
MDSYKEVRRVRQKMSDDVGHDIRALIAEINKDRAEVADRIIDPGTEAEQCDVYDETLDSNLRKQRSLIQQ